jgi:hypothetical protein
MAENKPERIGELLPSRFHSRANKPVLLAAAQALLGVPLRNAAGEKGFKSLADKRVGEKAALGLQQLGKVGTPRGRRLSPTAS